MKNTVNEIKCNNLNDMLETLTKMLKNSETSWVKGWSTINGKFRNYVSNKIYSGGTNIISLWLSSMIMPEILGQKRSYYYVTSKQAFDLKWKLKPECKNWSKDNEKRRNEIKSLQLKLSSASNEEREKLLNEINSLKEEINRHRIWEDIIFYQYKIYQIVEKDEKFYRQELVYHFGEYVVKSEKEVDKDYKEKHEKAFNNPTTEISTRFYQIAPIEFFEGEKKIKNRNTEFENYGTEKTFKELWDTLDEYFSSHNIKVNEEPSNKAYYNINNDSITLPLVSQFKTEAEALEVTVHEAGHSTGTKNRLNRNMEGDFNSSNYAKEELVAEICSLFFMLESNKLTDEILNNKLAYIKCYLTRVKENSWSNNLIYGINNGRKAFEYIIGADEDFSGDYE